MVKFSYEIDLRRLRLSEEALSDFASKSNALTTMFENCLSAIVRALGGLEGASLRAFTRILYKLDEQSDLGVDSNHSIELEKAEVDVLKHILMNDKVKVDPAFARAFGLYQQKLEELLLEINKG